MSSTITVQYHEQTQQAKYDATYRDDTGVIHILLMVVMNIVNDELIQPYQGGDRDDVREREDDANEAVEDY